MHSKLFIYLTVSLLLKFGLDDTVERKVGYNTVCIVHASTWPVYTRKPTNEGGLAALVTYPRLLGLTQGRIESSGLA